MAKKDKGPYRRVIARNKKAAHDYFIEDRFEAGIVLVGSEVKSLRGGKASLNENYVGEKDGALYLFNMNIAEYIQANRFNHEPRRPRKLLLHKLQIKRLLGKVQQKGYTLVATEIYFNDKNRVKVEIALCKGKKLYDKRATEKERDWKRDKDRALKER